MKPGTAAEMRQRLLWQVTKVTDVWKGLKTAELLIEQYMVRVESKSPTFSQGLAEN
jgi:hypothetical protein